MMETAYVEASTRFAFKLFGELARQQPRQNIFISPASVFLALAMAHNGAAGATQREIADVLELAGMELDEINRACAELSRALAHDDPGIVLTIANSLWARAGLTFDANFLRRNRAYYKATIEQLNFTDPTAPEQINAWVREQTHGKINDIVDRIPATAVLYLLNAIYFKGEWSSKFDAQQTKDGPFHLAGGGRKQLPMMRQSGEFPYHDERDLQAIVLPYSGRRLSMVVVLPRPGLPLGDLLPTLDARRWAALVRSCRPREGTIVLPRFELSYEAELSRIMKALGMTLAFEAGRADFSAMCDMADVGIDEIKHKTFLEVNEEGSEAAAVTSVRFAVLAMFDAGDAPFQMLVDRPFFCAILDQQSDAIVFIGAIVEP